MSTRDGNAEAQSAKEQELQLRPIKGGSGRDLTALHEQIHRREGTDRELRCGDSFLAQWCRMSNLSPDDFE